MGKVLHFLAWYGMEVLKLPETHTHQELSGHIFGTPTFVVILPDGEVNYNVKCFHWDQSPLDTELPGLCVSHSGGRRNPDVRKRLQLKRLAQLNRKPYYLVDLF